MTLLPARFACWTAWVLLALSLTLSTLIGLLTPYLLGLIALGLLIVYIVRGKLLEVYRPLASRLFLLAFVLIAVEYAITAQQPRDILYAFNFAMLLLFAPVAHLLGGERGRVGPRHVVVLAAAGVVLTLAMVMVTDLMGSHRPRGFNIGPIVLSNAALALAVVATMGTVALRNRWSLLLPATLALAIVTTVITQSRGPLIAVIPLLLFTTIFLWFTRFRGSWTFTAMVALVVTLLTAGGYMVGRGRIGRLIDILAAFFTGEQITDHTTQIRMALYKAGWRAFTEAPLFGHGWARLMSSATPYLSTKMAKEAAKLPQLHNDILNFLVAGGLVGLGIYLLIITTPIVVALASPRDSWRSARIYGTSALAIVYFGGGLTDLMFGHEFHTALYVMLNAIVLFACRDADPEPGLNPAVTSPAGRPA